MNSARPIGLAIPCKTCGMARIPLYYVCIATFMLGRVSGLVGVSNSTFLFQSS